MAANPDGAGHLLLEHPAVAEHVGPIRRSVAAFAAANGATPEQGHVIALGVSEAATNVVLHAYRHQSEPGPLIVHAWVAAGLLHVRVCDEGVGMTPRSDSPGAGHGLGVIAHVTHHFEARSNDPAPGLRLLLAFALV